MENLEQRRLLAAHSLPLGPFDVSFQTYSGPRNIGTVQAFNYTEQERLGERGRNDSFQNAEVLPLGNGPGRHNTIDVRGTLSFGPSTPGGLGFASDIDIYAVDLKAGDILDIATTGAATGFTVYRGTPQGPRVWFGTDEVIGAYPVNSPLQTFGNAALAQVVPEDGRYYIELVATNNSTNYTMGLRTYRPVTESLPIGVGQALFIDFEGGVFPRSVFSALFEDDDETPVGGVIRIPSLQDTLPEVGVEAANEAAFRNMLRSIVDQVHVHFEELGVNGTNGDFLQTGIPGSFGITILNSFDHPDPGNHPLVSRIVVGGTEDDWGFSTVGIADSVDVGNFNLGGFGLVQIDAINDVTSAFEISPAVSFLDAVARQIAVTVSHEAAHLYGIFHTDGTNQTANIVNEGGPDPAEAFFQGVGPDGIFGTVDDTSISFAVDRFSREEGIFGTNFVPQALSHALSTGTRGGTVTGRVFRDINADGSGTGDPGLAGVTVFADVNGNGVRDPFEPSFVTGADGTFSLNVPPGTFDIIAVTPPNASPTTPESRSVSLGVGATRSGINFGFSQVVADATGFVWLDANGNGFRESGEPGLEGVYVYLDLDGDGRPDLGEPSATTRADGSYSLNFPGPGTYTIRTVMEPGFVSTFPESGAHTVVYTGAPLSQNFNFGFQSQRDFSDAPASYGVPSHGIVPGLRLGPTVTPDPGPMPSPGADAFDDEDGVRFISPLAPDSTGTIEVSVTNETGSPAFLNAWIDFQADGTFGAGDQIATDLRLDTGVHNLTIDVPAGAVVGDTFARFRLSQTRGIGPDGPAAAGEVEDYRVTILAEPKLANDDTFSVTRNSVANELRVLENDFVTPTNQLEIQSVSGSSVGAQIVINTAGGRQTLFYSPPSNFLGRDTFTYTVRDVFGNTSTATVVVNVTFQSAVPIAVDDTFSIPEGSTNRALNVLDNDIASTSGGLTIVGVSPGSAGGAIAIIGGGQSVRYSPAPGFTGTEQFTYTVQDPAGNTDTAQVTVNLTPGSSFDDLVAFSFQLTDAVNNSPVSDIQVGERFNLTVSVDDLRPDTFGDPRGVASAFLDILYNANLVGIADGVPVRFGPLFAPPGGSGGFQRFDVDTPGLINEAGAVQAVLPPVEHSGPAELFTVTLEAIAPGIAVFQADPADDVVSETVLVDSDTALLPRQLRLGQTSLTIRDASNNFPSAIDDHFPLTLDAAGNQVPAVDSAGVPIVSTNQSPTFFNRLDVLANDNFGPSGTITEFAIEISPANGTVEINDNGTPGDLTDDFIEYVANPGFNGFDSFTYSIVSGDGVRSTAEVTLNVGTVAPSSLLVGMSFEFVDRDGNPVNQVTVGDEVGLRVDVEDLRSAFDRTGVFAGFLDVLYSADVLAPITTATGLGFEVQFGANMDASAATGFIDRPGIIDEFGTNDSRGSTPPAGELPNPRELATIFFTATSAGMAEVIGSPADFFPFRDTLLFGRDTAVPIPQIVYDRATLEVLPAQASGSTGGEGEGPLQNAYLPADVNNDGYVSAVDALIVINALSRGPVGEGEEAPHLSKPRFFYDVNGDGKITALDALMVINALSRQGRSGEGEAAVAPPTDGTSDAATETAIDADAVFAGLGEDTSAAVPGGETTWPDHSADGLVQVSTPSENDDEDDEFLALLADDVGALWN